MISGDGVFVLKTKHPLEGFEYRVAHSDDIGNIWGNFDDTTKHWKTNPTKIWETFRSSIIYDESDKAMDFARWEMSKLGTETECGIMVLSLHKQTWDELINLDIPEKV